MSKTAKAEAKPPRPTPTLQAMAAGEQANGLKCPRCGCIQFKTSTAVISTRHQWGAIVRKRVCRNQGCGFEWQTEER